MQYVPSENDRQLLATYAGEFSDGTPRGWEFQETPDGWEITLPNNAKLKTSDLVKSEVWASIPANDANTTILWRNSLAYLPRILNIKSGVAEIELVASILSSFLAWFESTAASGIDSLKSGSQDHQSALRIRTTLWILSFLTREERAEEFERFLDLYSRLIYVENRLINELDLFQPNNHGIMLGIAHLHTQTLLPDFFVGPNAQDWVVRLYSTLGKIIDEDGIASENTPIYQVFYVMLLEDVVSFIKWADKFSGRAKMFEMLLRAAQIGVRKQLLPNGAVPPLGDSPGGMQHRFKPMLGTLWSPNNGLAVISREDEHFSLVAGFRSVIHKQLDELSIAWWRNGDFIFRDAGLLSYDQNDAIAVAMRGPKGHSLPTYTHFDSWTTKNSISYGKNSSRLRGSLTGREIHDGTTELTAELSFDGNPILQRRIKQTIGQELIVSDTFTASNYGKPIVRYLMDPSIDVKTGSDGKLNLTRKGLNILASFETSKVGHEIVIEINDSYIALEHNKLAATKEIVVIVENLVEPIEVKSIFTDLVL